MDGTLHISTTRLCNLNCVYCSEWVRKRGVLHHDIAAWKNGIISNEVIYNDIKLWSKKYSSIVFSSGEPTLNSELPAFITYAKKMWFSRIELVTNGIRISDKKYLSWLIENGLTHLVISVNSFHPEISKKISRNSYDGKKTFIGIKNAHQLRVNLLINIVITKHTLVTLCHTLWVLLKVWIPRVTLSFIRFDNFNMKFDSSDRISANKISYSDLVKYAEKYKLAEISKKFDVCNYNDVPICVLQQMNISHNASKHSKPFIYVNSKQEIVEKENVGVTRLFFDSCKECYMKDECCGIEQAYVDIFWKNKSQEELYPIKQES